MAGKPYIISVGGVFVAGYYATFIPYRNDVDNQFKVVIYSREIGAGTDMEIANFVYPNGGGFMQSSVRPNGTLWARFYHVAQSYYDGIQPFDKFIFSSVDSTGAVGNAEFHLPNILGTDGTTSVWFGTGNRSYTDNTYNTIASGTLAQYSESESMPVTELTGGATGSRVNRTDYKSFQEYAPVTWKQRVSRGKFPTEVIQMKDTIAMTQIKSGSVVDWIFKPNYRVLFDHDGNKQGFEETNWHFRINDFGNLQKSIKTWTGETQVGNWQPEFIDEKNEIYGSLFGTTTASESRFKEIQIDAAVWKYPLKWVSQLRGELVGAEWEDGVARLDIVDKMKGLPDRGFVWDYQNIGTTIGGKSYGRVKAVIGTCVMFDDMGDITWIPRKRPGRSFLSSIFSGVIEGLVGGIVGGFANPFAWAGGFAYGFLSAPPSSDKTTGGYYKIDDYNVIPDDLVKSGAKLKFYSGSVTGFATNTSGPLFGVREHTVNGGTYISGLYGTVYLDDTSGIKKYDWIYVRKPMFLSGSPVDCINSILCGRNIDYPYRYGSVWTETSPTPGFPDLTVYGTSDFDNNFVNEIQSTDLFYVSKIITGQNDDTPFQQVTELLGELQISFFVDEDNQFSARSLRPRDLVAATSIATYNQGKNILDGFVFKRNASDAIRGVRYYYDYKGEGVDGVKNGYAKMVEMPSSNPLPGASKWMEIESQWLRREDDVKCLAYRNLAFYERGVDRISLPTTLAGVIHNVTDTINVNHDTGSLTNRLFEIDGYSKDFTNSKVTLEAFDIESAFGRGNCKWTSSSIDGTTSIQSGFSHSGIKGSPVYMGSLNGRITAEDEYIYLLTGTVDKFFEGKYLVIGSSGSYGCEIISFSDLRGTSSGTGPRRITAKRGLFSTIRKAYPTQEKVYVLANSVYEENEMGSYFQFGTTKNINSNIGTCYKFF